MTAMDAHSTAAASPTAHAVAPAPCQAVGRGLAPIERWESVAIDRFAAVEQTFRALAGDVTDVVAAARLLLDCLERGSKIMFCGNGGSAADAQHLSTELTGRFRRDRRPLAAIALTVDTSALTAIGNDFGFDHVFARQVRAIGNAGDVLVGISTSGTSRNVVAAFEAAADLGISTVAFVGRGGGILADAADVTVRAPTAEPPRIQECHIAIGHTISELLEDALT